LKVIASATLMLSWIAMGNVFVLLTIAIVELSTVKILERVRRDEISGKTNK